MEELVTLLIEEKKKFIIHFKSKQMKNLAFIRGLSIISLSLIISSCERGYSYNYHLSNSTDTIISVYFKTSSIDTNYLLRPKESKLIYSTFHGLEGVSGPFYQDVKFDFDSFVVKRGTKQSSKNYRSNHLWTFEKKDDTALYKAVVNKAEF